MVRPNQKYIDKYKQIAQQRRQKFPMILQNSYDNKYNVDKKGQQLDMNVPQNTLNHVFRDFTYFESKVKVVPSK